LFLLLREHAVWAEKKKKNKLALTTWRTPYFLVVLEVCAGGDWDGVIWKPEIFDQLSCCEIGHASAKKIAAVSLQRNETLQNLIKLSKIPLESARGLPFLKFTGL